MAKKKQLTVLVMTVKVSYHLNGVDEAEVRHRLTTAIDEAYKHGTLTGDTGAEVEGIHAIVCGKDEGRLVRAGGLRILEKVRMTAGRKPVVVCGVAPRGSENVRVYFNNGACRTYARHEEVLVV